MDYCPRCFRVGDDVGDCGNFALGCPRPVKVDPESVLVVRCGGRCNKTRAVPVGRIMQGKTRSLTGLCTSDVCKAVIVRPASPPTKARSHHGKDQ